MRSSRRDILLDIQGGGHKRRPMPEAPYFDALECRIYKSQVYRESIHGPGHTQVDWKFAIFLGVQIAKNGTQPETSRTADPQRGSCRSIASGWGSFRSCHRRMHRSIVRRVLGPIPGWRLQISRKTATGRSPGVALSIGTISFFQMRANRSGVRRPPFRGTKRWSGASALQSFMGVLRGR